MIKTIEEAREIALRARPETKVESEHELSECYVINLVPVGYKQSDGLFVGGPTRVDKKTGEVSVYNPMLEGIAIPLPPK